MAWTVRILGLPEQADWSVTDLPGDAAGQDDAVRMRFPRWRLARVSTRGIHPTYVARPATEGTADTGLLDAGGPSDTGGTAHPTGGPELSVITEDGPDAGRVVPLPADGLTVGRGSSRLLLDDPAAPSAPTRLDLRPTGLEVTEPDRAGSRLWDGRSNHRVGDTRLGILRGPQPPLAPPVDPAPASVDLGVAPAEASLVLPLAMAIGPLVIGVILASTTGQSMFLLFGLMSLAGVGVKLTLQRRARRRHVRLLGERARAVAARREAQAASPAQVSRSIRSATDDRFGIGAPTAPPAQSSGATVRWGRGTGSLPLSRADAAPQWQEAVRVGQPALTSPTPERATAVVGHPHALQPVARWALFQLLRHAVASGDALTVQADGSETLWWPGTGTARGVRLVLADTGARSGHWAQESLRTWRAAAGLPPGMPPALGSARAFASTSTSAVLAAPQTAAVIVGSKEPGQAESPGGGLDLVDLTRRRVRSGAGPVTLEEVAFTGIAESTLVWWLQELGDDVVRLGLLPGGTAAPPLRVPTALGQRTAVRHVITPLTAPVAAAGHASRDHPDPGGLQLDLADDGPHVLIAGTTGSGKSDLLLSVLVGLAAHHPPTELAMILLDFKGGASFGPLAALPHTMSLETNHVGAASLRTLDAIAAELRRREVLFSAADVPDYPTYRRRVPGRPLPRLVVAVDELRVLVDDHPAANAVLQRLAATGRSLGFHLLLATQRATGAVSSDVRSNLGATIALRTASEQESWDLIGAPDAARISPEHPGTAVMARGGRALVHFRAASWSAGTARPVWRRRGEAAPETAVATDWTAVVEQVAQQYRAGDWPVPDPVVSPALPSRWAPGRGHRRDAGALALLDDAARARHVTWQWPSGAAGNTAWIIERTGGRAAVLEALLDAARGTDADVLVLDGSGEAAEPAARIGLRVLRPDERSLQRPGSDPDTGRGGVAAGGVDADGANGAEALAEVKARAACGGTVVLTGWPIWAGLPVGETYRTFEEELQRLLSGTGAAHVRLGLLGGRELASARVLLHLPHRFYVPAGTSPEHRLVWPRLAEVAPLAGRAVHVCPEHPEPGLPAQLAFPPESPA